jgi:hypothetical protein
MRQELFDRSKLRVQPLSQRAHDMTLTDILPLDAEVARFEHPDLPTLADRIAQARRDRREVVVLMGAHVIKQGLSQFIVDLVRRGVITCIGMNGACAIHDYELARIGATTESVARYIRTGEFGLWTETGGINDIVNRSGAEKGFGTAVGEEIANQRFPHAHLSILAAAHESGVPATVHVGIGYDIIHELPNFDGAATGAASYRDFLLFAERIRHLERGVFLCLGSAVMGPEVYLKALSMSRNVERQAGRDIRHITTAVFDLADLGDDIHHEAPKTEARYYFRPFKTILVRTVADGGESFYIRGDHRVTIPALQRAVAARMEQTK